MTLRHDVNPIKIQLTKSRTEIVMLMMDTALNECIVWAIQTKEEINSHEVTNSCRSRSIVRVITDG